jgi:stress response protein SCP2
MAVNLQKGQKVSLKKSDGRKLSHLMIGLGWDAEEQKVGFFSSLFGGKKKILTVMLPFFSVKAANSSTRTILFISAILNTEVMPSNIWVIT